MLSNKVIGYDTIDNNLQEECVIKNKLIYLFELILVIFNIVITILLVINKSYYKVYETNLFFQNTKQFTIVDIIMQITIIISNTWIINTIKKNKKENIGESIKYFTIENIKFILFFVSFNTIYLILVEYENVNKDGNTTFITSMISYNIGAIQLVIINYNNKNINIQNKFDKYMHNSKLVCLVLQLFYNIFVSILQEKIMCSNGKVIFDILFRMFQYFNQWFITKMAFNIMNNIFTF